MEGRRHKRNMYENKGVLVFELQNFTHIHVHGGQVWGRSVFPFVQTQCHIRVTDRHWPSPYGLRWTPEIKMDLGFLTFALCEKALGIHQNDTQRSFSLYKRGGGRKKIKQQQRASADEENQNRCLLDWGGKWPKLKGITPGADGCFRRFIRCRWLMFRHKGIWLQLWLFVETSVTWT